MEAKHTDKYYRVSLDLLIPLSANSTPADVCDLLSESLGSLDWIRDWAYRKKADGSYAYPVRYSMPTDYAEGAFQNVDDATPVLLAACKRLADASAVVGDLDHAGAVVPNEAWAEMYSANCATRAAIAAAEAKP